MPTRSPTPPAARILRAWVLLRLPVPIVAAALAPGAAGGLVGAWLTRLDYAHGTVKMLLIGWQSMLLREHAIGALLALAAVGGAVLVGLRGRAWFLGAVAFAAALLGVLWPLTGWLAPLALALLAVNLAPTPPRHQPALRALAWIPGSELLLPVPVIAALGAGPRLLRVAGAAGAVLLVGGWMVADTFGSFSAYERRVFAPWPDDRVDPRVTTIARAPDGVKCDFHDIDVVGDRAVVVAEGSLHLLSVPLDGGPPATFPLTPWWGRMEGLAMDSETDPVTGQTWFVSGPDRVTGVTWDGAAWTAPVRSAPIPGYLHHDYLHYDADRHTLAALTIGTSNMREETRLVELDTPALATVRVVPLRLADGAPLPTIRDFAWVPPLGRYVLVPDFGERLYLADPTTGATTPWIETPTLNGRVRWVAGLDRLFVPLPNRPELWIVDAVAGTVERRLATQPGVRTLDVDVKRGLVLTASVLTGRVLVQRLSDGAVVDSFGTVMPMVRNLALSEAHGVALLSTWTALYRIPYASGG